MKGPLRAGVIGCGWAGAYHAEVYATHPMSKLVAVCDIMHSRAQSLANRYGCRIFDHAETMLAEEALEVVSVATPTEAHPELVSACLKRNLPVLCEKPLARTSIEARSMLNEAERAGVPLGVNYNRRFAAGYRVAKESMNEKERIRYFQAVLAQNVPMAQTEELRAKLPEDFLVYEALSHLLDLSRYLVGEPVKMVAYANVPPPNKVWTDMSVNLRFEQGTIGTLICSLAGPEWGQLPIERVEIATDDRRIVVENITQEVAWYDFREETWRSWRPSIFKPAGYRESLLTSIQAWIDALLEDRPPPISGEDGLRTVELCEQVVHSVVSGG